MTNGTDKRALPPLQDFQIRIARDGTWWHQGTPFTRPALVKLFATVLRRTPEGGYILATPVERGLVEVEDAPFVAVELEVEGAGREQRLRFRTNLDEWVTADREHPIRIVTADETGEPSPYVLVRDGLEARLARPVYYALAELAEERGGALGVWSGGVFFRLEDA